MELNRENNPHVDHKLSSYQILMCGFITGIFLSLTLTPVELVKCRMQVQARRIEMFKKSNLSVDKMMKDFGPIYKNTIHCFKESLRNEGIRGMYRGVSLTLLRDCPGNLMWFGVYEIGKNIIAERKNIPVSELGILNKMMLGGMAGFCYWLIGMPADTLKSVAQTEVLSKGKLSLKQLYKAVGYRNLYRGIYPTLMRAIPSNALIFSTYEFFSKSINSIANKFE